MDTATIELMRELATMKGKRNPDGTWNNTSISTLEGYLVRAIGMQKRAEEKAEILAKARAEKAEAGGEEEVGED